jgi:hypothetical protein
LLAIWVIFNGLAGSLAAESSFRFVHQPNPASSAERAGAINYQPLFQASISRMQTHEKITDDAIRQRPRDMLD